MERQQSAADVDYYLKLAEAEEEAAKQATGQVIERHIGEVMKIREQYPVDDTDLLSSKLKLNANLPDQVKSLVASLQAKMRKIVETAAQRIEDRKYETQFEAVQAMQVGVKERARAMDLINADKKLHVSCESIRLCVEVFSRFNNWLLEKLEEAKKESDATKEANLVLANAILVHELADFLIDYIEKFTLDGVQSIGEIKSKIDQENLGIRRDSHDFEERIKADPGVNAQTRDAILEDIRTRETALQAIEKEWSAYLGEIDALKSDIKSVEATLPNLRAIRENARLQIRVLQVMAVMAVIKKSLTAIQNSMASLQNIKLVPLKPDRVRRLLGYVESN